MSMIRHTHTHEQMYLYLFATRPTTHIDDVILMNRAYRSAVSMLTRFNCNERFNGHKKNMSPYEDNRTVVVARASHASITVIRARKTGARCVRCASLPLHLARHTSPELHTRAHTRPKSRATYHGMSVTHSHTRTRTDGTRQSHLPDTCACSYYSERCWCAQCCHRLINARACVRAC